MPPWGLGSWCPRGCGGRAAESRAVLPAAAAEGGAAWHPRGRGAGRRPRRRTPAKGPGGDAYLAQITNASPSASSVPSASSDGASQARPRASSDGAHSGEEGGGARRGRTRRRHRRAGPSSRGQRPPRAGRAGPREQPAERGPHPTSKAFRHLASPTPAPPSENHLPFPAQRQGRGPPHPGIYSAHHEFFALLLIFKKNYCMKDLSW